MDILQAGSYPSGWGQSNYVDEYFLLFGLCGISRTNRTTNLHILLAPFGIHYKMG
jgi:hypothetical protein